MHAPTEHILVPALGPVMTSTSQTGVATAPADTSALDAAVVAHPGGDACSSEGHRRRHGDPVPALPPHDLRRPPIPAAETDLDAEAIHSVTGGGRRRWRRRDTFDAAAAVIRMDGRRRFTADLDAAAAVIQRAAGGGEASGDAGADAAAAGALAAAEKFQKRRRRRAAHFAPAQSLYEGERTTLRADGGRGATASRRAPCSPAPSSTASSTATASSSSRGAGGTSRRGSAARW